LRGRPALALCLTERERGEKRESTTNDKLEASLAAAAAAADVAGLSGE